MKYIVSLFALFLFVSLASATPVLELERTTLQPQEVLIGKLYTSGTFKDDVTKDDIMFFEGNKQVFPESYEFYKAGDEYYLYVMFLREGSFTIRSTEILFTLASETGSTVIEEDITVAYERSDNESDPAQLLSIKPGIIYTLSNTKSIDLFNRGSGSLDITQGDSSFTIPPYQARTVPLHLNEPLSFVTFSSYKSFRVPLIYLGEVVSSDGNETEPVVSSLFTNLSSVSLISEKNQTVTIHIELINTGESDVTNITLLENVTEAKVVLPQVVTKDAKEQIEVTLFSGEVGKNETLRVSYVQENESFTLEIPLLISINESSVEADDPQEDSRDTNLVLCANTGGTLCGGECQGNSEFTSDGLCCYGECVAFEGGDTSEGSGGGYGWIIGLLIFIILGAVGYVIFKKYRKKKPVPAEKKIEVTNQKFENRMKGAVSRN